MTGFQLNDWRFVPVFQGRCATQADVEKGSAVFAMKGQSDAHALAMVLPQPALVALEADSAGPFPAVIVQAEHHRVDSGEESTVYGLITPQGEHVVALAHEVKLVRGVDPDWSEQVRALAAETP